MKKLVLLLCIICAFNIFAQNKVAVDDIGKITLIPVITSNSSIPVEAQALLIDKLNILVTQNGLVGHGWDERFVITANIVEIHKSKTATAPQMTNIVLRPTLYIGDLKTGTLYASCPLNQVKGAGVNDTKAYQNALKNINVNTPEIKNFVEQGKQRIVAYYETHIDDILNQAQSYANQGQYNEALATLLTVPESCKPQYDKAIKKSSIYYQQKINSEGAELLNTAKSIWHSSQTKESAESAVSYLSQINPSAACYPEAKQLYKQIGQKVDYLNEKQREFERKQYEDEQKRLMVQAEYEQQRKLETIRAIKEVGAALCSRPITYNYYPVYWW